MQCRTFLTSLARNRGERRRCRRKFRE